MPGTLLLPSASLGRQGRGRVPHTRHGWCSGCDVYTPLPARGCLQCGGGWDVVLDSGAEAGRHAELRQLRVTDLQVHPTYRLEIKGVYIGDYSPDFSYRVGVGVPVIEEVKSIFTVKDQAYQLRKRVFQACWGLKVIEVIR